MARKLAASTRAAIDEAAKAAAQEAVQAAMKLRREIADALRHASEGDDNYITPEDLLAAADKLCPPDES